LMGISRHQPNAWHGGQFLGRALRVAARHQDVGGGAFAMNAPDGLAKLVVGCSSDGAGIQHNQIGGGGGAGARKSASRERCFDGRSVGLRGAAAEGFDEESLQRLILSLWMVTNGEQWRSQILGGAGPFRQRLFAWGFSRFSRAAEDYMAPHKKRLFHN